MRKTTAKDLTGLKFNRLTALRAIPGTKEVPRRWICICECGVETSVATSNLTGGQVQSCGCKRIDAAIANGKATATHGMTNSPTYKSWRSMHDRCRDKENEDYGGRGITVCDRWSSFEKFFEDLGSRPSGMTLDRIDPNGNYTPDNCRWSDRITQMRNRRNSRTLVIGNESKNVMQVVEETGLSKTAVQYFYTLASKLKEHYGLVPTI